MRQMETLLSQLSLQLVNGGAHEITLPVCDQGTQGGYDDATAPALAA